MNLIIYVFLIAIVQCFESTCKHLQVSTDIDKSTDDIVKAGIPAKLWQLESDTFQLVNNSVLIDYLYVTLENKIQLTPDMVQLEYDDHYFANSTIKIEHHQNNVYSVKIDYNCKQYGGRLIQYGVIFDIPSCGTAKIYWQKLCGSPLIKRHGLNVDVQIKQYNQTVVRDGELVNKQYWDKDLDNYVFSVPSNINYSIFYIYMNLTKTDEAETLLNKEETKDFFQDVDLKAQEEEPDQEEFQVLEAILKLIPEVHISPPYVDADHTITKPVIRGDLVKGGLVTDEPSTLIVEYNCVSNGNSTIELNIPLQYFQDIPMVFQKQCVVTASTSSFSLISVLFYLICFGVCGFMIFTFEIHKMSLIDLRKLFIQKPKFNYKEAGKDEDYESEFKIGRLQENQDSRYGSI